MLNDLIDSALFLRALFGDFPLGDVGGCTGVTRALPPSVKEARNGDQGG